MYFRIKTIQRLSFSFNLFSVSEYDYDEVFGHSVEEDCILSPSERKSFVAQIRLCSFNPVQKEPKTIHFIYFSILS